jgi:hypothetical protein
LFPSRGAVPWSRFINTHSSSRKSRKLRKLSINKYCCFIRHEYILFTSKFGEPVSPIIKFITTKVTLCIIAVGHVHLFLNVGLKWSNAVQNTISESG